MITKIDKLPVQLGYNDSKSQFRHRAGILKGGKRIATGQSSLCVTRYISGHLGRSCHAEINACKQLDHYIKGQLPP